jgi:hypothetical protein
MGRGSRAIETVHIMKTIGPRLERFCTQQRYNPNNPDPFPELDVCGEYYSIGFD